jgi:hypothetical protein
MARKTATKKARVRRSYAEIFLGKLSNLAAETEKLVSNKTLRESLEWDESRYKRIRSELLDQNRIYIGKGFGGSVGLVRPLGSKGLRLFISYSHADEELKNDLLKHLEPLKKLGLIETWHDRQIKPGDEWDQKISSNLENAQIILLLVSIDFINSSYCYDIELEQALELEDEKRARVVPVILRTCMWRNTPFSKLQALPKDAKAVSLWDDRDDALLNVAEGVRRVAEEMLESR